MNHAWLSVSVFFVLAPAARSSPNQIWIVDRSGQGQFTQIQAAISAASDHDLILVRGGLYAPFTIDGKSLRVLADVGASVEVNGTVTVRNLPSNGEVLLGGIEAYGWNYPPTQPPGLLLTNNSGYVRLEHCEFIGSGGYSSYYCDEGDAGDGVHVIASTRVAFVSCTLEGGHGGQNIYYGCDPEGRGGDGGRMQNSSVALYDCLVHGGGGGEESDNYGYGSGGRGGQGWRVLDKQLFASRSFFTGGRGGDHWVGGDGGDGLEVLSGARAELLSSPRGGGYGGQGDGGLDGPGGQPQTGGGAFHDLLNQSRVFRAPLLVADTGTMNVDVSGQPGDRVWISWSLEPAHTYLPSQSGVRLNRTRLITSIHSLGTIPASGELHLQLPVPDLASGSPILSYYLQGIVVDTQGVTTLGSPMHPTVVDCASSGSDCNGNGQFDSCDLLSGFSQDCDLNSIPDECEIDCNGNSIPDACDIADDTSQDFNENGIPDECEPNRTWYVDDSAVAGGDGSASSPFQTIGEGLMAPPLSGDTILVNDGIYTGTGNRGLYWGSTDLVIRSANGPGTCIIDCEHAQSAMYISQAVPATSRLEGFTIRNGGTGYTGGGIVVNGASPTIANCVFEGCIADNAGLWTGFGGGLSLEASGSEVRDCVFRNNRAAKGGGLSVTYIGQPRIHHCLFENNVSTESGGGVYINKPGSGSNLPQISYCKILGNRSEGIAGGAFVAGGRIEQCLIVGNEALTGSALVCGLGRRAELVGSTLAANLASVSSLLRVQNSSELILTNAVVWGNSSLDGRLATLEGGGSRLTASYSDCQGGQGAIFVGPAATLTWGPGNIGANPFFVDPDGLDNDPLTLGDNDYRPGLVARCLDAGDNLSVSPDQLDFDGDGNSSEPLPFDLNGNPRFIDLPAVQDSGNGTPPIVDMGCYERQP